MFQQLVWLIECQCEVNLLIHSDHNQIQAQGLTKLQTPPHPNQPIARWFRFTYQGEGEGSKLIKAGELHSGDQMEP